MHPAKIGIGEPQSVSSLQVYPFLAEGVRWSVHPPHPHPNRKILPFNVARATPIEYWLIPILGQARLPRSLVLAKG